MLVKRLILLFIVGLFIFLAVPEASHLRLIWRDCRAITQYIASSPSSAPDKRSFANSIPDDIAEQDPEAARVAIYRLKGWSMAESAADAAAATIQYPGNSFFWTRLAESLACRDQRYDPQILRCIADRLLAIDPKNPDYYVLKASAVLRLRNGNDVREVLPLLHQAAQCPLLDKYNDPYRQRVMALAENAGLGSLERSFLWDPSSVYYLTRNMWDDLYGIAQMNFNDGRIGDGMAITDALNELFYAFGGRYSGPLGYMGGRNPLQTTALLELRDAAISPEREKYDRQLLASAALAYDVPARPQPDPGHLAVPQQEPSRKVVLAVPLLLHCARMVVAMAVILVAMLFLRAANSVPGQARVGAGNGLLFAGACVIFFVLSNLHNWLTYNDCCGNHLTYLTVLGGGNFSVMALWYDIREGFSTLFGALLPVIVTVAVGIVSSCLPVVRYKRICLAGKAGITILLIGMLFWALHQFGSEFIAPSLGGGESDDAVAILWIASSLPMLAYVWMGSFARRKILSILVCTIAWSFAAIWLALPYQWWLPFGGFLLSALAIILYDPNRGGFWRQSVTLFNAPQTAARTVALLVPAMAVYLLLIPLSVPWTMQAMKGERMYRTTSAKIRHIYPPPTPEAYQAVLRLFRDKDPRAYEIETLAVLEPGDLEAVLRNLNEEDWKTVFTQLSGMGVVRMNGLGEVTRVQSAFPRDFSQTSPDQYLLRLLDRCPRSSASVITAAFRDPNELSILLRRARLGDQSAKQPLLEALSVKFDLNGQRPDPDADDPLNTERPAVSVAAIAEALVPVSEPDGAAVRLIDILEKEFSDIPNPERIPGDDPSIRPHNYFPTLDIRRFARAVRLLPSQQAESVLIAFLDKCESIPPKSRGEYLFEIDEVLPFCANSPIADRVLTVDLLPKEERRGDDPPESPDFAPHLGAQSIPRLQSALTNPYASYRAWSVWQLRRLGHAFTDQEMAVLRADPEVSVRANLAMAVPQVRLSDFAADPSPIVQAVVLLRTTSN